MIGELSSALPFEGGYYAWVRRAMGNFWGFQEAWLSLVASDLRHGDLSDAVRPYLDPPVPLVCRGTSRRDGGAGRGHCLRAAEYCRRARGLDDLPVAVLRAVGAVHADCGYRAV